MNINSNKKTNYLKNNNIDNQYYDNIKINPMKTVKINLKINKSNKSEKENSYGKNRRNNCLKKNSNKSFIYIEQNNLNDNNSSIQDNKKTYIKKQIKKVVIDSNLTKKI